MTNVTLPPDLERAIAQHRQGQLDLAEPVYIALTVQRPDLAEPWHLLGVIQLQRGRPEKALSYFQETLKREPDHSICLGNLGGALFQLNRLGEAEKVLKQAISLNPESQDALYNLGNTLLTKGDPVSAESYFRKILQLNPGHAKAYNNLGEALRCQGQMENTLDVLQTGVEKCPGHPFLVKSLIGFLNHETPDIEIYGPHAQAQKHLPSISLNTAEPVADDDVRSLYQKCKDVLETENLDLQASWTQIWRGQASGPDCHRHKRVFEKHDVIPEFCFGCYKLSMSAENVVDLFKLMFAFDQMDLPNDNTRKCLIEVRPEISGHYKGLIYCQNLDEAQALQPQVEAFVSQKLGKHTPVSLKRGCSEYPLKHPNYANITTDDGPTLAYDPNWRQYEVDVDEERAELALPADYDTHNHEQLTLRDAITLRIWLQYAATIGDQTFTHVDNAPQAPMPLAQSRAPKKSEDLPKELEGAISRHRLGHVAEAEKTYLHFTKTQPDLAEPWHLLGVIALQRQAPEAAVKLFQEALSRDDKHVKCLSNLGGALYQLARFEEAEDILRKALSLDPGHVNAVFNLGNVLIELNRKSEAAQQFIETLRLMPKHPKALINLGVLQFESREYTNALTNLESAEALAPNDFSCQLNIAMVAERLNRLDRARQAIDAALSLQPDDPKANLVAATIDLRVKHPQQALERLLKILPVWSQSKSPDTQSLADTYFTLAQAHEALQNNNDAFAAFTQGNALELEMAQTNAQDPKNYQTRLDMALARLTSEPSTPPLTNEDAQAPVFFVGFPRSGTTLFEQMLASHPDIKTTNEGSALAQILKPLDLSRPADQLSPQQREELRQEYWQEVRNMFGEIKAPCFIETSPLSIRILDYAAAIFPNAKVFSILRDPRDVCLSSFMQQFQKTEELLNFTTLDTTIDVYVKLMTIWERQKTHSQIDHYEFHYEDLVQDMEKVTRDVLAFLNLPWSDEVLNYQTKATAGHIVTPSYRQVGEKLHQRACGRWRRYEKHLAPYLDDLAPFANTYGYDT